MVKVKKSKNDAHNVSYETEVDVESVAAEVKDKVAKVGVKAVGKAVDKVIEAKEKPIFNLRQRVADNEWRMANRNVSTNAPSPLPVVHRRPSSPTQFETTQNFPSPPLLNTRPP